MIKATNLFFSYEKNTIFSDLSFEIPQGDFVALIGPNGAGKTTLVKLLLGILEPAKGSLRVMNKQPKHSRDVIGYVPQKYTIEKLFPGTVAEILKSAGETKYKLPQAFGIESVLSKKFIELSGGQQQRVLIALALANKPKLLILDEPTVGVDIQTQRNFLSALKDLNEKEKITILLVTHDVGMVPKIAQTVLCINHNICCMKHSSQTKEALKEVYGAHIEHHHHHD